MCVNMNTFMLEVDMMSKTKDKHLFFLTFAILMLLVLSASAETWHLGEGNKWEPVEDSSGGDYLLAVSNIKRMIAKGEVKPAAKALEELKAAFPQVAGEDLEAFIQAEILYARSKWIKANRKYNEFLDAWPDSSLYESALERQFSIANSFSKGQKRRVLGILKLSAYEEADVIMHQIADRAGDAPISKRALITLAKGYQNRKKFMDAYNIWAEISSLWPTGDMGRDSLLEMAQSLHSAYKGHNYDCTSLISARTYYQDYKERYPQYVKENDVDIKIKLIDEQLAYKDFQIGQYYNRAEEPAAVDLYYQYTIDRWPESTAAKMADDEINKLNEGTEQKTGHRKLFDAACLFLDNWFGLKLI